MKLCIGVLSLVTLSLSSLPATAAPLFTAPLWTWDGNEEGAIAGFRSRGIGDVDGDGYDDIAITHGAAGGAASGRVMVFHGSVDGPENFPGWEEESPDGPAASFGLAIAGGDFDADGYSDLAIGCPGCTATSGGMVFVYAGSSEGLVVTPSWSWTPGQADAYAGYALAAEDFDADGYDDLLVGVPLWDDPEVNEGRAVLIRGSAVGLGSTLVWDRQSNQDEAVFGATVAAPGDLNGDGYSDAAIGAWYHDNGHADEGRISVHLGRSGGLRSSVARVLEANQDGASMGFSISGGDVNGDGYADLLASAPNYSNGSALEGRAWLWLGSPVGLPGTPTWYTEGNEESAQYGYAASIPGDLDGDGYDDIVISALFMDGLDYVDEGELRLFPGGASGPATVPAETVGGGMDGAAMGVTLAPAGDVNGDGYPDLLSAIGYWDDGEAQEGQAQVWAGSSDLDEEGDTGAPALPEGDTGTESFARSGSTASACSAVPRSASWLGLGLLLVGLGRRRR